MSEPLTEEELAEAARILKYAPVSQGLGQKLLDEVRRQRELITELGGSVRLQKELLENYRVAAANLAPRERAEERHRIADLLSLAFEADRRYPGAQFLEFILRLK